MNIRLLQNPVTATGKKRSLSFRMRMLDTLYLFQQLQKGACVLIGRYRSHPLLPATGHAVDGRLAAPIRFHLSLISYRLPLTPPKMADVTINVRFNPGQFNNKRDFHCKHVQNSNANLSSGLSSRGSLKLYIIPSNLSLPAPRSRLLLLLPSCHIVQPQ